MAQRNIPNEFAGSVWRAGLRGLPNGAGRALLDWNAAGCRTPSPCPRCAAAAERPLSGAQKAVPSLSKKRQHRPCSGAQDRAQRTRHVPVYESRILGPLRPSPSAQHVVSAHASRTAVGEPTEPSAQPRTLSSLTYEALNSPRRKRGASRHHPLTSPPQDVPCMGIAP